MAAFKYQLSSKTGPLTVEDYHVLARRAVPDMVWSYVDYGAEDMVTQTANQAAFSRYAFRRKVLTGNEATDLSTTIGGQLLSLPVLLAPTGSTGLSHWTGEVGAAQGAERAGTLAIVSTASSYSYEEVAAATERDHFFQLYPWTDPATGRHDLTLSLIQRAQRVGYQAMVVTVDVATPGNRMAERRRGMGHPPVITPRRALNAARKPSWTAMMLRHRRLGGRNLVDSVGARAVMASIKTQYKMMRAELTWDDFAFMREHWTGPLFLKGVADADDAQRAVDLGATGVIVSNHGGRQLDGDVATLDALPAIVARVGSQAQVLLDGGVRRGSDVVKALCLGADAVCIGRPYLYGLAVNGSVGVEHILKIFADDIRRTLTLMGVANLADLNPGWLVPANTPVP